MNTKKVHYEEILEKLTYEIEQYATTFECRVSNRELPLCERQRVNEHETSIETAKQYLYKQNFLGLDQIVSNMIEVDIWSKFSNTHCADLRRDVLKISELIQSCRQESKRLKRMKSNASSSLDKKIVKTKEYFKESFSKKYKQLSSPSFEGCIALYEDIKLRKKELERVNFDGDFREESAYQVNCQNFDRLVKHIPKKAEICFKRYHSDQSNPACLQNMAELILMWKQIDQIIDYKPVKTMIRNLEQENKIWCDRHDFTKQIFSNKMTVIDPSSQDQ